MRAPLGGHGFRVHLPRDSSVPWVGCWQDVQAARRIMSHLTTGRAQEASVRSKSRGCAKLLKLTAQIPQDCCMLEYVVGPVLPFFGFE